MGWLAGVHWLPLIPIAISLLFATHRMADVKIRWGWWEPRPWAGIG